MRRVSIALAAGLALLAVAIGVALLGSPMVVARKNGVPRREYRVTSTAGGAITYCQAGELVPKGVTAIRLALSAFTGPSMKVTVSADGHTIAEGTRGSGWTGRAVTVGVRPLPYPVSGATVCVSFRLRDERMTMFGAPSPRAIAAYSGRRALSGRMWIEYLRPGTRTWASLAPSILRRIGLGRVPAGTWVALLALELLVTLVIIASALAYTEIKEAP